MSSNMSRMLFVSVSC